MGFSNESEYRLLGALISSYRQVLSAAMRQPASSEELLHRLRYGMRAFAGVAMKDSEPILDELFHRGFRAGAQDAGGITAPDAGDLHALEWLKMNPTGYLAALGSVGQSEAAWFSKNLPGKSLPDALALVRSRGTDVVPKLERIVRTDSEKAAALGRLLSWTDDPNRDYFNYGWLPVHDDRTKDVSLLFERRNPMTFWQLRKTFEVDHVAPVMVTNRHTGRREAQISAFNCRCQIARWPKRRAQLVREGLLSQNVA